MHIRVENISKVINDEYVLQNVNIEMYSGKIYGLYGRNGSGKTMFMRCLSGMAKINEGHILCGRHEVGRDLEVLPNMGLLIENISFWKMYSGLENLRLLASLRNRTDEKHICDVMKAMGLNPNSKKPVRKYSLGMRQKLSIVQAVMEYPGVILLDEPTNALDERSVEAFRNLILEERDRGALIVISSHNREDIELLSDVKLCMEAGRMEMV